MRSELGSPVPTLKKEVRVWCELVMLVLLNGSKKIPGDCWPDSLASGLVKACLKNKEDTVTICLCTLKQPDTWEAEI